ncbi:metallophosphoesterase [Rhodopseudomonas palustris]|uniref:metallophosphoesterase family protein n=1 Tax=Rhodopseudomonas palustris TaxID=1076 RepID=UPI0022F01AC5|nr:metallophosphoesterase [Rhodopseudomonas palustris]WBU31158.1 metallophosphoesterase [Rhodopseudomonas palustris]
MATPRVMVRFRDPEGVDTVSAHNQLQLARGKVLWGLWLKRFEDKADISCRLREIGENLRQIYIADTSNKLNPILYVASVARVIVDCKELELDLVPEYYQSNAGDISIWFELSHSLIPVDLDPNLIKVLGVPTIYFLQYECGKVTNIAPQRQFSKSASADSKYILHLTDIHLGEDHGFRLPGARTRFDISSQGTLSEVIRKDLEALGATRKIAGVVISGDLVTRGGWRRQYRVADYEISGLQMARDFLDDLSSSLEVPPDFFFISPGNHDIVRRDSHGDSAGLLIDYEHEEGFRVLREDFCGVYRLSPLNYVMTVDVSGELVSLGMLNSAYLNDEAGFTEYGFVGDDAEYVFDIISSETASTKILALHHHVLPVYERELLSKGTALSLTLDAARIMRRAQETGVDLVLHGHQHFAKVMGFRSWSPEMEKKYRTDGRDICVVAGGSAGVKGDRLPSGESNTYGLIDVTQGVESLVMRRIYPSGRLGGEW